MTTLFVATGDSFARITQQGEDWNVEISLEGSGVQCLALDPHHEGTVYAGSSGEGVWKCQTSLLATRMKWSNMRLPQGYVFSLAVSAADGAVYAGCEPSMLFRSRDGGAEWDELEYLRDIPSAPTWSFPPRPWTSHVRTIAPSPHDANLLLVGIELGGVMRSLDGGETWADHAPGAQKDAHALAWHPLVTGRAFEAGGQGAAWSADGGATWQSLDDGLDRFYTWALAVDATAPDTWYLSASTGPRQAHAGPHAECNVYRREGSGPWQVLSGGLPQPADSMVHALACCEGGLFAGLGDGRIYHSLDRGESWKPLSLQGDKLSGVRALACVAT